MYLLGLQGLGDTLTRQDEHASHTVRRVLAPGPADRERVATGIRECYLLSGWNWHDNVVWVSSPDVLTIASVILGGRRCGLNEVDEISLSGRLRRDVHAAVAQAESTFTTPPASRQATLDSIEEHDAAWARWPAADDDGSSRTRARRHHYCLRHALGILRPADTLACGDALLSAPLFRTLDEGPIGTRVSREAQAPLRFAQLASLHDQANPALLDLRKQLGRAQASVISVFENAANMGDHSGRSIDDYLITELEVGQPLASRHGALSALESVGWTPMR
jgi:hypothetical protein